MVKEIKTLKINFAFTLAEVLITLGIIGIVAQATIPTLVKNMNNQTIKTSAMKAISILNQTLLQMDATEDDLKGKCEWNHVCLRNAFLPYLKVAKTCDAPNNSECISSNVLVGGWENGSSVVLNDGTAIIFYDYNAACTYTQADPPEGACGEALIDLNGVKKPNLVSGDTVISDIIWVEITPVKAKFGRKDAGMLYYN